MRVLSICFAFFSACVLFSSAAQAQTFFSRNGGGNWGTAATWSTTGHAGVAAGTAPTAGSTVIIGDNDAVTFQSGTPVSISIASLTINDDGDGGSLTFGNGA